MASQSLIQLISGSANFKAPIKNIFKYNKLPSSYPYVCPEGYVKPFELVMPRQKFGIEVEIENIKNSVPANLAPYWAWTEDGSLRNNGIEFVSKPLCGDEAIVALDALYKWLNKVGATCSPRTSVHMHVNMQDYTMETLWNILMLYIVYERVLYDFIGNDREKNNFCIPLYSYPRTFDFISNFYINPLTAVSSWLKYTGLNLKPLTNSSNKPGFGTIEFRHFSGSKDVLKVGTWVNIILSLVRTATEHSFEALSRSINTTSPHYLTQTVFKELAHLFYDKPLQVMISEGIRDFKLFQHMNLDTPTLTSSSDLYKALCK
jgi:Putative amidoligase enzyme